jgi:hypothetical protein
VVSFRLHADFHARCENLVLIDFKKNLTQYREDATLIKLSNIPEACPSLPQRLLARMSDGCA